MAELIVDSNPDLRTKLIEQDVLIESQSQPILLTRVEVNGGESFSYDFFNKLLNPLLLEGDYTLSQLTNKIAETHQHLLDTGVFKDIGITLTPDYYSNIPAHITSFNHEKSLPAKVVFDLSNINLNINETFLNFNNEEFLNLKLNHIDNNFNENAELVSIGVDYNPYKPYDHLLTNLKFISGLKNPSFKFLIDVGYNTRNNHAWQDFKENQLGGRIGLLYKKRRELNIFTGFSLHKRNLFDIDDGASDDLKFFGGEFLKSSVLNTFKYENLNYLNSLTKNFPTSGINFNWKTELSSVQEQNNQSNRGEFFKSSFGFNLYKSIFYNYITTKFNGEFGGIYSFNSKFPIHPLDKFYLGGYNNNAAENDSSYSFVGFKKNSIEPNGGLQFYKLQATIYSKIPHFIYAPTLNNENCEFITCPNPLRMYGTFLIGNALPNFLSLNNQNNIWNDKNPAISYGFGLKYFNNWANFDIGYYVSSKLGFKNNDEVPGIKNGLQFSISIGGSNRNLQ
ncbi:uncharacterized protein KGF55_002124 [Candida pseudojiufengensis]|uniref:uncharacterized protein n=1 Tax=Candida pseudojiufengensis TaxID=497109 RepID=UPI002224CE1C|nr:uncharacterized protein KGF55_002124 [Candida pseudojiufengensis]KAI5964182.1 hypothetical protein KGF55_002124 [Candida pseudojiufengensis]